MRPDRRQPDQRRAERAARVLGVGDRRLHRPEPDAQVDEREDAERNQLDDQPAHRHRQRDGGRRLRRTPGPGVLAVEPPEPEDRQQRRRDHRRLLRQQAQAVTEQRQPAAAVERQDQRRQREGGDQRVLAKRGVVDRLGRDRMQREQQAGDDRPAPPPFRQEAPGERHQQPGRDDVPDEAVELEHRRVERHHRVEHVRERAEGSPGPFQAGAEVVLRQQRPERARLQEPLGTDEHQPLVVGEPVAERAGEGDDRDQRDDDGRPPRRRPPGESRRRRRHGWTAAHG